MKPIDSSSGVVCALPTTKDPEASTMNVSVIVPPASIASTRGLRSLIAIGPAPVFAQTAIVWRVLSLRAYRPRRAWRSHSRRRAGGVRADGGVVKISRVPAVLVHGNPDSHLLWELVQQHLDGSDTDVVAVDLPGFAEPAPDGFTATKEAYVD